MLGFPVPSKDDFFRFLSLPAARCILVALSGELIKKEKLIMILAKFNFVRLKVNIEIKLKKDYVQAVIAFTWTRISTSITR